MTLRWKNPIDHTSLSPPWKASLSRDARYAQRSREVAQTEENNPSKTREQRSQSASNLTSIEHKVEWAEVIVSQ